MTVEARLAYDDEKAALAFLTTAFGLREQARMRGADDSFMAWLGFGHSTLMIGRSGLEHHNLYSPRQTRKPTAQATLLRDHIHPHFQRAIPPDPPTTTP